jgi:hypothetical protein
MLNRKHILVSHRGSRMTGIAASPVTGQLETIGGHAQNMREHCKDIYPEFCLRFDCTQKMPLIKRKHNTSDKMHNDPRKNLFSKERMDNTAFAKINSMRSFPALVRQGS